MSIDQSDVVVVGIIVGFLCFVLITDIFAQRRKKK